MARRPTARQLPWSRGSAPLQRSVTRQSWGGLARVLSVTESTMSGTGGRTLLTGVPTRALPNSFMPRFVIHPQCSTPELGQGLRAE